MNFVHIFFKTIFFQAVTCKNICLGMMHSHINFEIFMLHYWPDMRKIKKSQKSKIEKKNRCVFRFLGITFLFRKMVNRDRNQNAPFWTGFRTMYRKYMFSKNKFWDKNRVKWGMDLVRKLKNGRSKSKSEKKFRKMKKNGC